jgi:hypothetical protein
VAGVILGIYSYKGRVVKKLIKTSQNMEEK